jgi:hypothetical protein
MTTKHVRFDAVPVGAAFTFFVPQGWTGAFVKVSPDSATQHDDLVAVRPNRYVVIVLN